MVIFIRKQLTNDITVAFTVLFNLNKYTIQLLSIKIFTKVD